MKRRMSLSELGLRVHPVADHLLFGAHVLHEALDRFGEVGHRRRRRLAGADFIDGIAQPLDRFGDARRQRRRAPDGPTASVSSTVVASQSSRSV